MHLKCRYLIVPLNLSPLVVFFALIFWSCICLTLVAVSLGKGVAGLWGLYRVNEGYPTGSPEGVTASGHYVGTIPHTTLEAPGSPVLPFWFPGV